MILSQYCNPVGKGRGSGRNGHKPGKEFLQWESSVEAIAEFRQKSGEGLFPDRMIRPMERILHVSQDRVHPPEVRGLTAFGSASRNVGLVNASGLVHPPEGSQSVRDCHRRSGEVLPGPAVDHRFAKTGHSGQPKAIIGMYPFSFSYEYWAAALPDKMKLAWRVRSSWGRPLWRR